jgi:LmbE family N-acetylglucosaminyl deacetylase
MAVILAIHAHPDDIEHLGAGTLSLLAAKGHVVKIVTVTAGECGSVGPDLAETAAIRKAEAATAAAMIGAEYRCADLPDLGVFNDDACRRRVTEMVRWAAPDIVITASPVDYHPDHEAASLLVRDACFAASVPHYVTGPAEPTSAIPHLYFMDPIGGRDREGRWVAGDFGVDISAAFETKGRMLLAHESQHAWVARQHGITDHLASMEAFSRRKGQDFGVEYGEGFRQYRNTPYPRTPRLQELIGEALRAPTDAVPASS